MKIVQTILFLASLASALPSSSPPKSSCSKVSTEKANFDELTGSPVNVLIPEPYKGLRFQAFAFTAPDKSAPGNVPHSLPNFAVSNAEFVALNGSAEWTVLYESSKVKSFSLQSFYYGCVLGLANGLTALPAACDLTVTAYKSGDQTGQAVELGAQTFNYRPSTMTGPQQQAFGSFYSLFKDMQYVLVTAVVASGTVAPAGSDLGISVDDIVYTLCYQ